MLADFAATKARECKACHSYASLVASEQTEQARRDHTSAMKGDDNCLSCDQGVTHARQDKPASYDFP